MSDLSVSFKVKTNLDELKSKIDKVEELIKEIEAFEIKASLDSD